MGRFLVLLVLGVAGCFSSHGQPSCEEDLEARCVIAGEWVFPSEPCGMDHSLAVGLCAEGRAVLETPPRALGGAATRVTGSWELAVSPELVSVRIPDAEMRLEWRDDESLGMQGPPSCTSDRGYRIGDDRLDLGPGWSADWARGVCDR